MATNPAHALASTRVSMRLKGRTAIVTGAAQGIGLSIANRLAADGARVVFADINIGLVKSHAKECAKRGCAAIALAVDVRRVSSIRQLMKASISAYGSVDILVNNAAIQPVHELFDVTEEEWNDVMAVNLRGPFFLAQAVAQELIRSGRPGVIINISSTNSVVARPDMVAYATSKGGTTMLTRGLAVALAPHKIRVVAVAPGTIETPNTTSSLRTKSTMHRIMKRTPLRRVGLADEIAAVVAFIACDEASYMTGTTIFVEGGRLALGHTDARPLVTKSGHRRAKK